MSEPRKMIVNLSGERLHWYPAWEECNIDDADDVAVLSEEAVAKSAEMSEFPMCKICETKPR